MEAGKETTTPGKRIRATTVRPETISTTMAVAKRKTIRQKLLLQRAINKAGMINAATILVKRPATTKAAHRNRKRKNRHLLTTVAATSRAHRKQQHLSSRTVTKAVAHRKAATVVAVAKAAASIVKENQEVHKELLRLRCSFFVR